MKKQAMLAAPFLAAVAFVCQPLMAEDKAVDRAANQADRAADGAGSGLNRAADRAGQSVNDAATAAGNTAADAAAQVAGARQQGNMDQKFAMRVADINNFEIQAGRLAQEKAQRDEVKQYARMTVEDHTQAQQQLQQIAQQKNMQLPSQLMPVHQAMLQELSQMDAQEFEKAYLYGQVAGHTKAVLKLRDAKTELQDAELRQYATKIFPKMQGHLQHAQKLANADEAMTAGARIGGSSDSRGGATHDQAGHGATDRLRPGASENADNTGGGRPERGASPTRGADAPGAGPSAPGNEGNR